MDVSMQAFSSYGDADAISKRIRKLENEWDIDRLEVMLSSGLAIVQYLAGRKKRHWLFKPQVQVPLFILATVLGKTPMKSLLRHFGFRSKDEIAVEKERLMNHLQNREIKRRH